MQPRSRILELDGLRGLAILLVMLHHYVGSVPTGNKTGFVVAQQLLTLSWSGVDLFFVLSGFLIGSILIDNREASNYFRTFYLRRTYRIFPLYFTWLLLWTLVIAFALGPQTTAWVRELFGYRPEAVPPHAPGWVYWTFTQNIHTALTNQAGSRWLETTWSLALEEQFYLLLPLTIWLCPPRRLKLVVVILMLFSLVLRPEVYAWFSDPESWLARWPEAQGHVFIYQMLPTRLDGLFMGVFCALLVREPKFVDWLKARCRMHGLVLAGLGLAAASFARHADIDDDALILEGYFCLAAFYACLTLFIVVHPQTWLGQVLRWGWLRWLGTVSFGIYLFHQAANWGLHGWLLHQPIVILNDSRDVAVTLLAAAVTLTLAGLSWRFFEKPIIERGHAHRYKFSTAPDHGTAKA